jgi:hypothetical protein
LGVERKVKQDGRREEPAFSFSSLSFSRVLLTADEHLVEVMEALTFSGR